MIETEDRLLLSLVQLGLPICARPYQAIGQLCAMSELEVIDRLTRLLQQGLIKRMGVIVKHRALGYRANAMVVWDIPDQQIKSVGVRIGGLPFVNLCYQRPRLADWPYNLYCMIHGKDKSRVLELIQQLIEDCGLQAYTYQVLFSMRCFKQRGAIYQSQKTENTNGCR